MQVTYYYLFHIFSYLIGSLIEVVTNSFFLVVSIDEAIGIINRNKYGCIYTLEYNFFSPMNNFLKILSVCCALVDLLTELLYTQHQV